MYLVNVTRIKCVRKTEIHALKLRIREHFQSPNELARHNVLIPLIRGRVSRLHIPVSQPQELSSDT